MSASRQMDFIVVLAKLQVWEAIANSRSQKFYKIQPAFEGSYFFPSLVSNDVRQTAAMRGVLENAATRGLEI